MVAFCLPLGFGCPPRSGPCPSGGEEASTEVATEQQLQSACGTDADLLCKANVEAYLELEEEGEEQTGNGDDENMVIGQIIKDCLWGGLQENLLSSLFCKALMEQNKAGNLHISESTFASLISSFTDEDTLDDGQQPPETEGGTVPSDWGRRLWWLWLLMAILVQICLLSCYEAMKKRARHQKPAIAPSFEKLDEEEKEQGEGHGAAAFDVELVAEQDTMAAGDGRRAWMSDAEVPTDLSPKDFASSFDMDEFEPGSRPLA